MESMVIRLGANPPKHNWNIMWEMWRKFAPVPNVNPKPPKPQKVKAVKVKPKKKDIDRFGYTISLDSPEHTSMFCNKPWRGADRKGERHKFGDFLIKKGFVKLGSGAYSVVYGKPGSDRVIKVCTGADDWIEYCYWGAKQGQAGKLAPKVYSYKTFKDGTYIAVMERMEYVAGKHDLSKPLSMFTTLVPYVINSGWNRPRPEAAQLINYLVPGSADYLKGLAKLSGHLDLHDGNYMFRSDGSICITDPVTSVNKTNNFKRLREKDFSPAIW